MAQQKQEKVELFPAWEWICPKCDRNSFASSITLEITPDDPQYQQFGGEGSRGAWMSMPENVTCKHCGAEFETEWDEEDEEGHQHDLGGEG